MALLFALIGILLVVVGVNGTTKEAGELLKNDFTGPNNFIVWIVAILFIGALGYIPKFRPISYGFLTLLFLGIFLANQRGQGMGVFEAFSQSIEEFSK